MKVEKTLLLDGIKIKWISEYLNGKYAVCHNKVIYFLDDEPVMIMDSELGYITVKSHDKYKVAAVIVTIINSPGNEASYACLFGSP